MSWALACFAAFAVVAVLVTQGWGPLTAIDDRGNGLEGWAVNEHWLRQPLKVIELCFATIGMTVLTTVLAGAMLLKGHRRAAIFAVVVMIATSLLTTFLKLEIGRGRPPWQNKNGLLSSQSFPSGHASSITAFVGIILVLVVMLVRRSSTRRTAYVAGAALVLLVCADRVLLGRHYPSDVTAGALLGAGMVLLGLTVLNPLPRSHAQKSDPLPEVLSGGRRLAVVLNPIKVEDEGQFRAIVGAMAAEAGWDEPTWHRTTIEDPGTGMAEAASIAGADLVLVCGGDGTVREVCAELAGTGIPVGIVPAGTGNLLARNLDIPLYLRAAIDVALTGQDRAIDLVRVGGDGIEDTHFMVMAGMGFDAAIMEGVNEDLKKKVGWVAYVLSGLKSLMFPAVKVEVSVDGGEFTKHRARTVVVGNVGFLQAGLPLLPDAAIDDGLLDVVILHPRNFFSWIPLAWRVLLKLKRSDDLVNRMTGATVVVRSSTDTPRQLDGDSIGLGRELRMECVHGRLLVRVPR
ncbi:phosphatase PAP2 family protein [Nocardioides sp. KIGAM211]|uniref:Phosphatase PAP2 family protein n=1 Tax=Nocardioides luti TaxID=2761101 RepID=A0A7X0RGF6_9ACTN|nr:phosphatase PAP2 family protein [Nocardioides luti]